MQDNFYSAKIKIFSFIPIDNLNSLFCEDLFSVIFFHLGPSFSFVFYYSSYLNIFYLNRATNYSRERISVQHSSCQRHVEIHQPRCSLLIFNSSDYLLHIISLNLSFSYPLHLFVSNFLSLSYLIFSTIHQHGIQVCTHTYI